MAARVCSGIAIFPAARSYRRRCAHCCGYSKVLKSRGLLILLKLSLVSDEGVYIIVARPKATSYGRTFTVNGRVFTCRHLVDCVTFGADFGRLQPAKQQCGCHGLKRRHSDLFPPTRLECCHVLRERATVSFLIWKARSTFHMYVPKGARLLHLPWGAVVTTPQSCYYSSGKQTERLLREQKHNLGACLKH